ncbi:MAG: 50S ribosomal protein L24 [Spirochaetaceae bacterium]|nr:MAG: 50S ribosomal protein L24 [Spirochaetaceae bacterium]
MASKYKLKRDDTVLVIAGKDKGKTGKVLRIDADKGRVLVEGINYVKKAVRRKRENEQGGIIEIEAMLDISNVMPVSKGQPTRIGVRIDKNGKRVRVARKTGEDL